MEKRRKVILDVDTGTDDATAIMAAVMAPGLEVLAICTEHGTNPLEQTTKNTLQVIELLGAEVPVYMGCPKPLARGFYYAWDAGQHVSRGKNEKGESFGYHDAFDLPEPSRQAEKTHAVTYLIETLRASAEKVTLVACGPLTSVGAALRIAPDIAGNIEEIVCMGGGVAETNITMSAEANIWRDPEAAQIVLLSGAKVTFLPLDATHRAALPAEYVGRFEALETPVGAFFAELLRRRIQVYNALQPLWKKDIAPIHDALCVAYLLDPKVLTDVRHQHLEVCLDHGPGGGSFLVDTRHFHEEPNAYIAYDADATRFGELLLSVVSGKEGR